MRPQDFTTNTTGRLIQLGQNRGSDFYNFNYNFWPELD
jgi:hypothetical protein